MSTLHDPVCLVGITVGGNTVCTLKMVQNIILMNESQEVGGLRRQLQKKTLSRAISDIIGRNDKTRQCPWHHFQLACHLPNILKCICAKNFQIFAAVKT